MLNPMPLILRHKSKKESSKNQSPKCKKVNVLSANTRKRTARHQKLPEKSQTKNFSRLSNPEMTNRNKQSKNYSKYCSRNARKHKLSTNEKQKIYKCSPHLSKSQGISIINFRSQHSEQAQ